MLESHLLSVLKNNAPVRSTRGAVGKRGTNMYSPYPGNLKNNGIVQTSNGVKLDINHVGYIWYANKTSSRPDYVGKSVDEFLHYCQALGARVEKK